MKVWVISVWEDYGAGFHVLGVAVRLTAAKARLRQHVHASVAKRAVFRTLRPNIIEYRWNRSSNARRIAKIVEHEVMP